MTPVTLEVGQKWKRDREKRTILVVRIGDQHGLEIGYDNHRGMWMYATHSNFLRWAANAEMVGEKEGKTNERH